MKISKSAEIYTWRQLARRVGIPVSDADTTGFEQLDLPVHYGLPDDADPSRPNLTICRANDDDWDELLTLHKQDLIWNPPNEIFPLGTNLPFQNLIPALFWGRNIDKKTTTFAEQLPNGSIVFYADILAASLFMLSRWEETVAQTKDRHSRFPAASSVAYKLGFLTIPIVDQYALILREWLKLAVPGWAPRRNVPEINLTHDVDHIYQYASPISLARALTLTLASKQPLKNVRREFKSLRTQLFDPQLGEKYLAIYELANRSKEQGLKSRFYFMAAKASLKQQGYNPAGSLVQKAFRFLQQQGHEIGFHPGYTTFENPGVLSQEKECLENALGEKVLGGRQHFLRFRVPYTWRHWEQVRLKYDSTLGYADHEGFRCGTCHPYKPFDLEQDREIDLLEIPLIVMDTTLIEYRKMTITEGRKSILELARKCVEVEGKFTLLWHNVTLVGKYIDWGNMYIEILPKLKKLVTQGTID